MIKTKFVVANSTKELEAELNAFLKSFNPQMLRDIKLQIEYDGQSYTQYTAMVIYND